MADGYSEEETLKQILVKKKHKLVDSIRLSIVPPDNPVWSKISNELNNEITPKTAHMKAYYEGFREFVLASIKNDADTFDVEKFTTSLPIEASSTTGKKKLHGKWVGACLKRRHEILRLKSTSLVSAENPVWASIARKLNDIYTPQELRHMVMEDRKYRDLVLPKNYELAGYKAKSKIKRVSGDKRRRNGFCRDEAKDGAKLVCRAEREDIQLREEAEDRAKLLCHAEREDIQLRDEINRIVLEDTVAELTNRTDSLIEQLNMAFKINEQILKELRMLRADLAGKKNL